MAVPLDASSSILNSSCVHSPRTLWPEGIVRVKQKNTMTQENEDPDDKDGTEADGGDCPQRDGGLSTSGNMETSGNQQMLLLLDVLVFATCAERRDEVLRVRPETPMPARSCGRRCTPGTAARPRVSHDRTRPVTTPPECPPAAGLPSERQQGPFPQGRRDRDSERERRGALRGVLPRLPSRPLSALITDHRVPAAGGVHGNGNKPGRAQVNRCLWQRKV